MKVQSELSVHGKQLKKKKKILKNFKGVYMRKEYNLKKMKLINNPYLEKLKKSVTIRLDADVIDYFKELSEKTHIPYQTLVNEFLKSCKEQKMTPKTIWKKSI